ncbi:MAG: 4'-phosphopantetheinyl transferase superfamily protein [Pseudobutyrivibrio sp.]|nr:4'-phosphopantetheinyl transferase superfamily protein [Pseudobutyrivibrio sp.]
MVKAAAYYCHSLNDPKIFSEVYHLVSRQRQEHVDESHIMKTRCERLGASHLLEKLLWENHIARPYEYGKTSQGKPILTSHDNVYFSISHSGGIAVVAIGDKPVGIDIEKIDIYKRNIAERFFTKNDLQYLDSLDYHDQPRKFTEVWSFKEAMCKMMDRPLTQVMQWIDFHEYCDGSHGKLNWTKQGYEYGEYYITLCYEGGLENVQMKMYDPLEGKYY